MARTEQWLYVTAVFSTGWSEYFIGRARHTMLPGTKVWTEQAHMSTYMVGKAFVAFIKGASCAEQPLEPVTIYVNACALYM
ncbi:hypothetical protein HDV62DRAFT_348467 [Trichoderma sp. SZMC 28011]